MSTSGETTSMMASDVQLIDLDDLLNDSTSTVDEATMCQPSTSSDVSTVSPVENAPNGSTEETKPDNEGKNETEDGEDSADAEDSAGESSDEIEEGETSSVNNSSPEKIIENGKRKASQRESKQVTNGKKKKKSSNPNRRRNIKKVKSDDELAVEVIEARKEEEERIKRQHQILRDFKQTMIQNQQVTPKKVIDEIYLSSDEEELSTPAQIAKSRYELIELLDSDSDECPTVEYTEDDADENGQVDYNNCGLFTDDKLNVPDESGRVLINVGHASTEQDICLAPQIARAIKPHQIGGVRFMYANIIESREKYLKSPGVGCILAHSMGLGKTIQVISFIDIFFRATPAQTVLCVVPINTLQNWVAEFDRWIPATRKLTDQGEIKYRTFTLYVLNDCKTQEARCREIMNWKKTGGVMLLGYEMYRIICLEQFRSSTVSRELIQGVQKALVDPGPDLVVCDEGHRIKNCHSSISKALKKLKTKRRIVLTGYPLQNNLMEYWCMVDWVRPNYLGTDKDFANMFEKPIKNGQCIDSTYEDRRKMRYRAHVLYQMLRGFVQRRSQSILKNSLPTKIEYVFLIAMTPIQRQLFTALIEEISSGQSKLRAQPILLFSVCNKIWNHPDILYHVSYEESIDLNEDLDLGNSTSSTRGRKKSSTTTIKSNLSSSSSSVSPSSSVTFPSESVDNFSISSKPLSNKIDYDWARKVFTNYQPGCLENSHKMSLLFTMIDRIVSQGERLLLFSQSLLTLNLIEKFLNARLVPEKSERWRLNSNYYRLDGSTSPTDREKLINTFNSGENIKLFLLSTRAGSLGINLIGANRIIVFDASWNPCHDAQAACRIYRYGQTKNCFIYRLICDNSLERVIYDRQISKEGLSHRVVDELNPETNIKEIASLLKSFNVEEVPPLNMSQESIIAIPDPLVQEICAQFPSYLTTEPFQHESLLLDHKETKLTKTEKQKAFENYQMDKQAKEAPKQFYGANYTNNTPMSTGLFNNTQYPATSGSTFNGNYHPYDNRPPMGLPSTSTFVGNFAPMSQVHSSFNDMMIDTVMNDNYNVQLPRSSQPSILGRPRTAMPPGGGYNPNYTPNFSSTTSSSSNNSTHSSISPIINPNNPHH